MGLARYKEKRNFSRTPEPAGGRARKTVTRLAYVIQKHAARRLHYDFRLEMDGVLKSWAVPKGIPTVKGDKRLAMEVEDHPIEYGSFEGTIPEGNYGAGTVMLWDHGTYEVSGDDPVRAWKEGKLHFWLHGKKLEGEWALVRMRARDEGDKKAWLLIKSGEDYEAAIKETSVVSGLTMEQIAKKNGRVWESGRAQDTSPKAGARRSARTLPAVSVKSRAPSLSASIKKAISAYPRQEPGCVVPMKALLVEKAPEGAGWMYEIKWDGYRALGIKKDGEVTLCSRSLRDVTADFPEIAEAVRNLPSNNLMLDGEIVALDATGHASFQRLQNYRTRPKAGEHPDLYYYVFDLLNLEKHDLKRVPLQERKDWLQQLLQGVADPIRFSAGLQGDPKILLAEAGKNKLEGLVAKRTDSCYEPERRSSAWLKIKLVQEQEFVIGGYTQPKGTRPYFGAVVVGYYRDRKLYFASKVGTGFDDRTLKSLYETFQQYKTERCPVRESPEPASLHRRIKPGRNATLHLVGAEAGVRGALHRMDRWRRIAPAGFPGIARRQKARGSGFGNRAQRRLCLGTVLQR